MQQQPDAATDGEHSPRGNELTCDVLVVGSGAGGLAAAVTAAKHGLNVLVAEKEPLFGGTTAYSGGWLWIPGHPYQKELGVSDSIEEASTYLLHECGERYDAGRVNAFLTHGPRMVEFFVRSTAVRFMASSVFADYHPDAPGGKSGGRSIVAAPFDGRELGPLLAQLREPLPQMTAFGLMLASGDDIGHFMRANRSLRSAAYVLKRFAAHARDLFVHQRGMRLTNGNALAARLLKSAVDAGVGLLSGAAVRELIRADGRVRGAFLDSPKGPVRVEARRGIVLACGGFPRDAQRQARLFPHVAQGIEHVTPAPPGNTGDGLRLAEAVGARIDEALPNTSAWMPVSQIKRADGSTAVMPHFVDRGKPGFIAVMRAGRRFVNEANSYHDFVQALRVAANGASDLHAFFICDHRAIRRYGMGYVKPAPLPLRPHLKSGYLLRGRTVAELAAQAGIDAAALAATIERYNTYALHGKDPDFHKGENAYNRCQGDVEHQPNACVAPLAQPPYYAVKVVIGDLGTFAGISANEHAQALDANKRPIPGLYVAGNDMASIMGGNYPGPGITLGPAMTFGYIAGRHLAGATGNA
jgi:succinate dehydrogenase/fumarate reductase flavoprotein subunit